MPLRSKLGLVAEILGTYVRVRLWLRRMQLQRVVERIRSEARPGAPGLESDPAGLGAAVMAVLAVLPTDSRCLVRSLVCLALISRRGTAGTLVIGARTEPFAAHAWIEVAGEPVLPSGDGEFQRLTVL